MSVRLLTGDCRDMLKTLPDASVQCCVTSPPYYGLRDYGTAQWEGGDAECDHSERNARNDVSPEELARRAAAYGTGTGTGSKVTAMQFRATCGKCGAKRIDQQIGLEASPDEYVATLVEVFREVRRVLRDDGVLWLNLGDSYASQGGVGQPRHWDGRERNLETQSHRRTPFGDIKPKDLLMMPARVAMALQADGWWLRSQMPWIKRSCMPESVTDRPTAAIEYVFLLTKSANYYWDAQAVARRAAYPGDERHLRTDTRKAIDPMCFDNGTRQRTGNPTGECRNFRNSDLFFDSLEAPHGLICDADGNPLALDVNPAPFKESHFATFPPKLITPLIKAATRSGDTVLDPFFGAGTTGLVCDRLGRDCIGIDLNRQYADMAHERIKNDAPLFAEVIAE